MNARYIVGLLIVFICLSCTQRTTKSNPQTKKSLSQQLKWNSGVQIKNGLGRGLSFKDSLGTEYGHGHLRNTITNDSTLTMNLQLDFTKEYNFPAPYSTQKFKVILWPEELELDNVISQDSVSDELRNFLAYGTDTTYTLNILIEPQEKYVMTFGTLQQFPTNCYVSPNMMFVQNDVDVFPKCENLIKHDQTTNSPIILRLRLDFSEVGCSIIPIGQITYSEH